MSNKGWFKYKGGDEGKQQTNKDLTGIKREWTKRRGSIGEGDGRMKLRGSAVEWFLQSDQTLSMDKIHMPSFIKE